MLFKTFLPTIASFCLFSTLASAANWDATLAAPRKSGVDFGIVWAGDQPFEENAEKTLLPASVMKMFTAYAVLKTFQPDYKFQTKLQWQNVDASTTQEITNLTLQLNGDPTWGLIELKEDEYTRVRAMAAALKAQGITKVHGEVNVVLSDKRWLSVKVPQGWKEDNKYACYGAQPGIVVVQRDCGVLVVKSLTKAEWQEKGIATPINLNLKSGTATALNITLDESNMSYNVSGTWLTGSTKARYYTLPIYEPHLWAKNLLKEAMMVEGIAFVKEQKISAEPVQESVFESVAISEIVRHTMKNSINVVAQSLMISAGLKRNSGIQDPNEAATVAMKAVLKELGVTPELVEQATFKDASGMSRENLVSPKLIFEFLEKVKMTSEFTFFWDALPVAGVDGTLEDRMRGTYAQGMLRAKTGTLDVAKNLAGFIPKKNSSGGTELFPFVFFGNFAEGKALSSKIKLAQDKLGPQMVLELNPVSTLNSKN